MMSAPDLVAEAEEWVRDGEEDTSLAVDLVPRLIARIKELEAERARVEAFVRHKREIGQGGVV